MSFSEDWIENETLAPATMQPMVQTCRDFIELGHEKVSLDSVAALPKDVLIALATVLAKRGDGNRIAALQTVRTIRKTIGKVLHQLRSEGHQWSVTEGTTGKLSFTVETLPSYLSVPHPSGSRFLILCDRHPDGSMAAIYGLASETEGLGNFVAIPHLSRSKLKKLLVEVDRMQLTRKEQFMVEADSILVRTRFREAVEIHRRKGKPFPEDYHAFSDLIRGPLLEAHHPVRDLFKPKDGAWLTRGPELFGTSDETTDPPSYKMGAVDRPIMDRSWMKNTHDRLLNAMQNPVLINDSQRSDQVLAELDRVISDTFDAPFRIQITNRMLDSAYVLWKQGQHDLAHIALATADALADATVSALDIPWAKEAFVGLFDAKGFVQANQGKADTSNDEETLIVPG